jgi:hypothetical protein
VGVIAMAVRRWVGISVAAVVAASALAGVATTAEAGGGTATHHSPAVSVRIPRTIHEGQRGTFLIDLAVRCRSGFVATELEYTQEQFDWEPATGLANVDAVVCDGRWHTIRITGFEGFQDGPAVVSVRLTVAHPTSGVERTATDREEVWVRSASDIRSARVARILDDGRVAVRVTARCDEPWVASQLYVWIERQPEFGGSGSLGDGEFPCDGGWHTVAVTVTPSFGVFQPGTARIEASIDLRDAEHFDPVDQTMRSSRIRLVRA